MRQKCFLFCFDLICLFYETVPQNSPDKAVTRYAPRMAWNSLKNLSVAVSRVLGLYA